MNRRAFLSALSGSLLAAPLAAEAQPTAKVYRIGFIVTATSNETGHLINALTEGLREVGYVRGGMSCLSGGLRRGGKSGSPLLRRSLFS
jgi:hypothetical protein